MSVTVYKKTGLTGGTVGKLDSIDGSLLLDLDMAFVTTSSILYVYILDDDSGAAESSPDIISPDTNAGTKRWILQGFCGGDGTLTINHIAESTAAHGVNIDGLTLKDGGALIITGGTNTFNLTNGTASLDVAAACTVNVDKSLTVQGAYGTVLSSAGQENTLTLNESLTVGDGNSGTLTFNAASKTLTVSNSLTLAGTDSTTMTFPSTSATIARTDAGQTFTGDQYITGKLGVGISPTTVVHTYGTTAATANFTADISSDTRSVQWIQRRVRTGTSAVQNSDSIGQLLFHGYTGAAYTEGAAIIVSAADTVSAGVLPTKMDFYTTTAAGSEGIAMTIQANKDVNVVGSLTTSAVKPSGSGSLSITDHDGLGWTVSHGGNSRLNGTQSDTLGTGMLSLGALSGSIAYWNFRIDDGGNNNLHIDRASGGVAYHVLDLDRGSGQMSIYPASDAWGLAISPATGTHSAALKFVNTGGNMYVGRDNSTGAAYSTGSAYAGMVWVESNHALVFGTNNTARVTITNAGVLDVAGSERVRGVGTEYSASGIITSNAYYSSGWLYRTTAAVSNISFSGGDILFQAAASGTADNVVSWNTNCTIKNGGNVLIGAVSLIGAEILRVDGDAYFDHDVSALTFTDRTPAQDDLETAYEAIRSIKAVKGKKMLDHKALHKTLKSGENGRDLSMTVSTMAAVINSIIDRIEELEAR